VTFKFLLDENLSPELVELAVAAGYGSSTCVRDRGLAGLPDWKLMDIVIEQDFTLVTLNNIDFRGADPSKPGGLYSKQEVHAGLVCLSADSQMDIDSQKIIFQAVLDVLKDQPDLINKVLEFEDTGAGEYIWHIYPIPLSSPEEVSGDPETQGSLPERPPEISAGGAASREDIARRSPKR
jgi:hypothetical protein